MSAESHVSLVRVPRCRLWGSRHHKSLRVCRSLLGALRWAVCFELGKDCPPLSLRHVRRYGEAKRHVPSDFVSAVVDVRVSLPVVCWITRLCVFILKIPCRLLGRAVVGYFPPRQVLRALARVPFVPRIVELRDGGDRVVRVHFLPILRPQPLTSRVVNPRPLRRHVLLW